MRAFGAELIEAGHDFDAARDAAIRLAAERGLSLIPPFNLREIIAGTGTIGLEILETLPEVAVIAVRSLLKRPCDITRVSAQAAQFDDVALALRVNGRQPG